jgi:hypothetical protein
MLAFSLVEETRMPKSRQAPKRMSADEFADKLTGIFERKLAKLPEVEQDTRIDAFYRKASSVSRGTRAKVSRPQRTQTSPRAVRSRE